MRKEEIKGLLKELIDEYYEHRSDLKLASEQTMRSWIDKFLLIFGWDCKNTMHVDQEKMLTLQERQNLKSIKSKHLKPDYTLKNGRARLNFLDAKDLNDNIKDSKEIAFQAKSYGWSANLVCSIVTNIEEIAFYSCSKIPTKSDDVELDRIYMTVDEYIEKFDILYELLYRDNVVNGIQDNYLKSNLSDKTKKINLDDAFASILSKFRLKLAQNIYSLNEDIIKDDSELLSKMVQSIINRIMFIRICEGRKLEEDESLKKLLKSNFWREFKIKNKLNYEKEYDGPVFYQIKEFEDINIDNIAFADFIEKLYDPYPYRFDVIPTELLAAMYERFISYEIFIEDNSVKERQKSFYVKQQGVVSTPKYMVDTLLDTTLNKLSNIKSLNELLDLKILEPSCGSGTFLLGILEHLEDKAIELYKKGCIEKYQKKLFVGIGDENINYYPTIELKRLIISNCIYAIDMDYQAVEVARLSLALKSIDNYSLDSYNDELGLNRKLLLNNIGKNIIHGNTLIESDIKEMIDIKSEYLDVLVPLDIKEDEAFGRVFAHSDKPGFDYIVGNPPYVETKVYIDELPYCREYFKKRYSFDGHKADMCIYFIERCVNLLNDKGKMSFLCQKRFFKTEYGIKAREYLSKNRLIDTIINFEATDIFHDRTTYVAIMILNKNNSNNDKFNFFSIKGNSEILKNKLSHFKINTPLIKDRSVLKNSGWNLCDNIKLENLILKLEKEFETLGKLRNSKICDIHGGIQVLRNDVYYIDSYEFEGDIIKGKNRRKLKDKGTTETDIGVVVEKGICRPIAANKKLKKFQTISPNYYAIIPYDLDTCEPIGFKEIEKKYKLCAEYLANQESYIRKKNKEINEGDYWHTFTRTTNLRLYKVKRIAFPMTAKEIVASYINTPIYLDNSNMWGLHFQNEDEDFYLAMTAILNSNIFSVMAIYNANPQAGDYSKMNKQFVLPVPIPYYTMKKDTKLVNTLKDYSIDLIKLINKHEKLKQNPNINASKIRTSKSSIELIFKKLNDEVYNLYGLKDEESRSIFEKAYKEYTKSQNKK